MEVRPYTLSFRNLLSVYYIVPCALIVALCDQWLFAGTVRAALPSDINTLFVYVLFLNIPHFIASLFSFAEGTYLRFYARTVAVLGVLLLGYAWILSESYLAAFLLFVLYTEYHVMNQQAGIASAYIRKAVRGYALWRYLGMAVLLFPYVQGLFDGTAVSSQIVSGVSLVLWVATSAFALLTPYIYRQIERQEGRFFVIAISGALMGGVVLMLMGYGLFAVLVHRFVHDITAFMVYLTHDTNRAHVSSGNWIYRIGALVHIPVVVLCVLLAVGVNYLVLNTLGVGAWPLLFLFMAHYVLEGVMWKRGSLHRAHVSFT